MAKFIIKKTDDYFEPVEMDLTLENLQEIVGGYIETVSFADLILIVNEEGKLLHLPANIKLYGDLLCGDIAIVRAGDDDFEEIDDAENVCDSLNSMLLRGLFG